LFYWYEINDFKYFFFKIINFINNRSLILTLFTCIYRWRRKLIWITISTLNFWNIHWKIISFTLIFILSFWFIPKKFYFFINSLLFKVIIIYEFTKFIWIIMYILLINIKIIIKFLILKTKILSRVFLIHKIFVLILIILITKKF